MGQTYTRQSSYSDGDVITAAHTNDEFNQLLAAFQAATGHSHDGTANEGGAITTLLGNALTLGPQTISGTTFGTLNSDTVITFNTGDTNTGVFSWDTSADYFQFSDDILMASTEKLQFRDTAIYINSSADGQLDLVADTEIQIAASTIDMDGNADISGNLAVGGNLTVTGTTTFNGGTMTLGDAATDNVVFGADVNSSIIPNTDSTFDLGSSSQEWRDIYIDGTAYIDTLNLNGAAVTSTAGEINILAGGTSATSTTLADADRVVVNDNGTMVQVALTDFETYFESALDTLSNVTTVGALNSGSITSGFGSIDNGSSAITTTGTITYGSLSDGSITVTAFVDEDDMSSNSATLIPTQQSVKAYVDAQITAEDLDVTTDSGTIAIDLDSETLTFTGGTGIDTSATGNAVTFAVDSTVVTESSTNTLTNKTLTTPTITTPIVNAGIQLKNGATSAGFLEFFEDSDNGTNKVTLIGPSSTSDITLTLPSSAGTVATTATAADEATALAIALG